MAPYPTPARQKRRTRASRTESKLRRTRPLVGGGTVIVKRTRRAVALIVVDRFGEMCTVSLTEGEVNWIAGRMQRIRGGRKALPRTHSISLAGDES